MVRNLTEVTMFQKISASLVDTETLLKREPPWLLQVYRAENSIFIPRVYKETRQVDLHTIAPQVDILEMNNRHGG